jgi:hypothetical protein
MQLLKRGSAGADVRVLQKALKALGGDYASIAVDGVFGADTERLVKRYQSLHALVIDGVVGPATWSALTGKPLPKPTGKTLRDRAYSQACALIGVMKSGGNNRGPMVDKIIRANGGAGPEPWCGDGMAYCYRAAGSKAVTRAWAAVRLLAGVLGIKRTSKPQRGDLVRFNFSRAGMDHVGMFVRDRGDGTIETIECNTGPVGAVSDGNGNDGVYRKVRSKVLVADYLAVTR